MEDRKLSVGSLIALILGVVVGSFLATYFLYYTGDNIRSNVQEDRDVILGGDGNLEELDGENEVSEIVVEELIVKNNSVELKGEQTTILIPYWQYDKFDIGVGSKVGYSKYEYSKSNRVSTKVKQVEYVKIP